jgi:hypothetical protein
VADRLAVVGGKDLAHLKFRPMVHRLDPTV